MKKIKSNQIIELIEKLSQEHCHNKFGYLDKNDMKNEIWVICLEQLEKYEESRGDIEHFLRVAVKTRLINRFKDVTKSVKSPCPKCPFFDRNAPSDCAKFGDSKMDCDKWKKYQGLKQSRNSLLNIVEDQNKRTVEDKSSNHIINDELKSLVLQKLPLEYHHDFTQLTSGGKLNKQREKLLINIVKTIINEDGGLIQNG